LVTLARTRHADGIICGHIHQPADRMIDGIHYLNSGDWVESMSALLEDEDGTWKVYIHRDAAIKEDTEEITEIYPSNQKLERVAFSNNIFHHFF